MNANVSKKVRFLTVLTLCLAVVSGAVAQSAFFYQAPGSVGGMTATQLGGAWWKWAIKQPKPTNQLIDTTGKNCGVDQPAFNINPAKNIWWLAGAFNGGTVVRNCTVPLTRTLVFPIVNGVWLGFPSDPADQKTDAFLNAQVAYVANATGLSVTFDGIPLNNPKSYYVVSDKFTAALPVNNIYDVPGPQVIDPGKDAGYYVGVTLYVPGFHTLKFKGTVGGVAVDVTYNLTVGLFPG